jgi:hypothetical protein
MVFGGQAPFEIFARERPDFRDQGTGSWHLLPHIPQQDAANAAIP